MKSIVVTLFILWIFWKVAKSAIEEMQQRMQNQSPDARRKAMPPREGAPPVPLQSRTSASHEPDEWEIGEPVPGEEQSELESWFQEALEHKRTIEKADRGIPPEVTERIPPQPPRPRSRPPRMEPRPAPPPMPKPQPAARHAEPRTEHRREVRVKRKRVVRRREPVAARPAQAQEPRRPARRRREIGQRRIQRPVTPHLKTIGKLNMNDVRRGIILAEILGTPKALRDIDSHVI